MKNLIIISALIIAASASATAKQVIKTHTPARYQCQGTTKDGQQCQRSTNKETVFCYQHSTTTKDGKTKIQCSGTTKAGTRCKLTGPANPQLIDNTYLCHHHINQQ